MTTSHTQQNASGQNQTTVPVTPTSNLAAERHASSDGDMVVVGLAVVLALGFLLRAVIFRPKPGKGKSGGCSGCRGDSCH